MRLMAKIAIVQDIYWEYLGVMYISSFLKRNAHTVEVFIGKTTKNLISELLGFKPDLVAFPVTTGMHSWAIQTARAIKENIKTKVLFGAYHPTFFPEVIEEEGVDIVCRGEAEEAMLELANKIERKEDACAPNCWSKIDGNIVKNDVRSLIQDIDCLPFPDRELYISKYPFMKITQAHVISGRGCPFNCSFCFNHAYRKLYKDKGNPVRLRSAENVIQEIKEIKAKYNVKTIYMQDDTFTFKKDWTLDFLDKYASSIGLPFVCMIRADVVDEEIIRALKSAGCKNVFFGLETGSENLRNTLLNKKLVDEEIIKTANLLRKYGIRFRTFNMLNIPGETLTDAFSTVEFNQKIKTDFPWCSLYYPYPGTELADYAIKLNLIDSSIKKKSSSFFKTSIIFSPYRNELINLQKLFFYAVKFPKLFPFIKKVIKTRPNVIFDLAFLIGYAYSLFKSENLSFSDLMHISRKNLGSFFQ